MSENQTIPAEGSVASIRSALFNQPVDPPRKLQLPGPNAPCVWIRAATLEDRERAKKISGVKLTVKPKRKFKSATAKGLEEEEIEVGGIDTAAQNIAAMIVLCVDHVGNPVFKPEEFAMLKKQAAGGWISLIAEHCARALDPITDEAVEDAGEAER